MYLRNISTMIYTDVAMAPVAAGTGDTQNGLLIDTLGAESVVFIVYLGAIVATGTATIAVQYGNASNGSDQASVTNGALPAIVTAGQNLGYISIELFRPTKRYVRVTVTRATANVTINGAIVLLGREGVEPPIQGVTMGNVAPGILTSP